MVTEAPDSAPVKTQARGAPTSPQRKLRKTRIKLRSNDRNIVLLIGAITGAALILVGLRPTGSPPIDIGVTVVAAMFIVWAGCTAPWQVLTISAVVACAIAPQWIGTAVGLVLIVAAALIGIKAQSQPILRAVVIGAILNLLAVAGPVGPLGLSAALGTVVVAALVVTSVRRRPSTDRKLAMRIGIGAGVFVLVALVGLAVALIGARNGIEVGSNETKAGLSELRTGDVSSAVESLNNAEVAFANADRSANAPWGQLSRLVPVAAQYRATATTLTSSAHEVAGVGTDSLRSVDPQSLRLVNGRIDVAAVTAMREPVVRLQDAVGGFAADLNGVRSVWLPQTVISRMNALADDLAEQQKLGASLIDWIDIAPELLGANGPRTYFLMFTTPAEARGQGGFMGNYAELTVDNGAISMTKFGRHSDLNEALPDDFVLRDAPADWMNIFGGYGFRNGEEGTVGRSAWSIIDMSAHFPNTAQVISSMYPASGGKPVDGVFSLDVYGMQALVGLVGPVEVEGAPPLNGDNTAQYLLVDQYAGLDDDNAANANRVDMLQKVAGITVERLLNTNPPDPVQLGKAIAPLAAEGRVLAWSPNPEVEALFERAGLDGRVLDADSIAASPTGTGLQLVVNNGAGSKIDAYLERGTSYDEATGTVSYDFTNTAPSSGASNYVIGNVGGLDLPKGTSLLLVSLYSTVPVDDIQVDGASVLSTPITEPLKEADRFVYQFRLTLSAGASSRVTVVLPADAGPPVIVEQPLRKSPTG